MQVCLHVSIQIYTHFSLEILFSYTFVCIQTSIIKHLKSKPFIQTWNTCRLFHYRGGYFVHVWTFSRWNSNFRLRFGIEQPLDMENFQSWYFFALNYLFNPLFMLWYSQLLRLESSNSTQKRTGQAGTAPSISEKFNFNVWPLSNTNVAFSIFYHRFQITGKEIDPNPANTDVCITTHMGIIPLNWWDYSCA